MKKKEFQSVEDFGKLMDELGEASRLEPPTEPVVTTTERAISVGHVLITGIIKPITWVQHKADQIDESWAKETGKLPPESPASEMMSIKQIKECSQKRESVVVGFAERWKI